MFGLESYRSRTASSVDEFGCGLDDRLGIAI